MGNKVLSILCDTHRGELQIVAEERRENWLHLHISREGGVMRTAVS
jgi:hypothetical protein